jgi:hypothetical protein
MYFCHCFSGFVEELGILVADEGVGLGFGVILESTHLIADGLWICTEGT